MNKIADRNVEYLRGMANFGVFLELDPNRLDPNMAFGFCGEGTQGDILDSFFEWCRKQNFVVHRCGWFGGGLCLPEDSPVVRNSETAMLDLFVLDQLRFAYSKKGARLALLSTHQDCLAAGEAQIDVQQQLVWLHRGGERVRREISGMQTAGLFWSTDCPVWLTGSGVGECGALHPEIVIVDKARFEQWLTQSL